jgi:non-canonical (house-cleaning) NTP pyrophosphatase
VPNKYVESIKKETLGVVMDRIFNESDLHNSTGGIGLLTREAITRIDLTAEAFTMALTPFINENWNDFSSDVVME